MTSTETTTPGAPAWLDYAASDLAAATAFYGPLLGWSSEPLGDDWVFKKGDTMVAGLTTTPSDGTHPAGWMPYLLSLDVDSTSLAAHSNGGDVLGRHGEIIIVKDSQDALVGAWSPGEHKVFVYAAEPGHPVWYELHAENYDSALEFYQNVFEWEPETLADTPEFRFSTLGSGDAAVAGIFDAKNELGAHPTFWLVYFGVESADDAATKVVELGGAVLDGPTDTPYGKLVHATDPAGNRFSLMEN